MKLPAPTGKYPVGYASFTTPVSHPFVIGGATLDNGRPALELKELAFGVFYPAVKEHRWHKGVAWLPSPVNKFLSGYATFAETSKYLVVPLTWGWAKLITMRVFGNAELISRPLVECDPQTGEAKWPLVIFSHGLGGTRTAYSTFCSDLASEGYVVLAIEHRDRSGPMVLVRSPETGELEERPYLTEKGVHWEECSPKPDGKMPWKIEQLTYRRTEVYEVLRVFTKAVNEGDVGSLQAEKIGTREFDWTRWRDKVQCDKDVIFAGHSFGAATGISLQSQAPAEGFAPLPISQFILLDPWIEPFPPSGPIPYPLGSQTRVPIVVITSEAFAVWDIHFHRLKDIVEGWRTEGTTAHLLTILRSKHLEFSDFGVVVPGAKRARQVLIGTHETVMKFVRGSLGDELKGRGCVMEIEGVKDQRMIKGVPGQLFVHQ